MLNCQGLNVVCEHSPEMLCDFLRWFPESYSNHLWWHRDHQTSILSSNKGGQYSNWLIPYMASMDIAFWRCFSCTFPPSSKHFLCRWNSCFHLRADKWFCPMFGDFVFGPIFCWSSQTYEWSTKIPPSFPRNWWNSPAQAPTGDIQVISLRFHQGIHPSTAGYLRNWCQKSSKFTTNPINPIINPHQPTISGRV